MLNRILLVAIAVLFAFPITVSKQYSVTSLDLALIPLLALSVGQLRIDRRFLPLLAALAVSGASVAAWFVMGTGIRPAFAILFFFRPYFFYLLGNSLVRHERQLRYWIAAIIFFCLIVYSLVAAAYPLFPFGSRIPYNLQVLGLELAGSTARNVYAAYVTLLFTLGVVTIASSRHEITKAIAIVSSSLLLAMSLTLSSRQAALAVVFFVFLHSCRSVQRMIVVGGALAFTLAILIANPELAPKTLVAKLYRDADHWGDIHAITAGRTLVYKQMIVDLVDNPLFGSHFSGFADDAEHIRGFHEGLSPHNQYLGALWKMGLLPFGFYSVFLAQVFLVSRKFHRLRQSEFSWGLYCVTITTFLVLLTGQDFYTFMPSGAIFFFLIGGVARIADLSGGSHLKALS